MERAGVASGREIDRRRVSISHEEAQRIVGYFDKDGDGLLSYSEFMSVLQSTKNSVLTKRGLLEQPHHGHRGKDETGAGGERPAWADNYDKGAGLAAAVAGGTPRARRAGTHQ